MILISVTHCTKHWTEKAVGLKITKDFSRQVLVSSFLRAQETDHCSTARFHKSDACLRFALSHCTYEHVVYLELRQSVSCLVHRSSSVRRTSCATCRAEWEPVFVWYVSRVVQHPRGIRRSFWSPQGSWCLRFNRNSQLTRLDLHRRLLACLHLKLPEPQASRHHQQRRLPRPRPSTHFLRSPPSHCDEELHSPT